MNTIGELLSTDLSRKIEEITQVDQSDEESVYQEITQYIPTDSIRGHYASLLRSMAEAAADPHEGIGVWISGFFGSGKSSFAKNLGYAVQNRQVCGHSFASLFKKQVEDQRVSDLLDLVNAKVPTDVVLFDVSKQNDIRTVTERLAEKIYTVVLRELGYAEDFEIAELEIELEAEGRLEDFVQACQNLHGREWRIVRKGAQRFSRASAVLHELEPKTYPSPESWAHAQGQKTSAVSVSKVVERTFELMGRRRPGTALMLVIDEVGQHVARSGDKIEDLRATVEEFGKVGKNLLKARRVVGPCWIVVTSQEKLDEVVAAIDSKRVDLAKLQDRFRHRVDLAPSDIREVATKRVLAKTEEAERYLKKLFLKNPASLNDSLRLERTARSTEITESDFVQFYPYPPHYVDLCIGIMSGIRLQPGAPKHYGGSNRTIIKQAYEMLVNERTAVAQMQPGSLVTLDKVYELVEGNLSSEKQRDIHDVGERIKAPEDGGWSVRVAKVVCLLEFVRDLPRTEKNIAALLVDSVDGQAPLAEVSAAVKRLHEAQFLRRTEEGWKLQTAQEKNWDTERRTYLDPKPRERNEIVRGAVGEIFGEPAFRTYRYGDRTFRVGVSVDDVGLSDGDLALSLRTVDDVDELAGQLDEVRTDSRQASHSNDIYWVYPLTSEVDQLVEEFHASRSMIEKYRRLRAARTITADEVKCLQDEEATEHAVRSRLRDKLTEALERGTGMFRGVGADASSLGGGLAEITRKFLGRAVPDLYPKLKMGTRPLKGNEAEVLLKAADLKALPPVFYSGEDGLGVVVEDDGKFVPNVSADVTAEVLEHLKGEHSYGNRDSLQGKALEKKFGGIGYGWDRDMLRLILAVLFRAGAIEVSLGGQKFDSPGDPRSREPFTNNTKFKSALFTPVKPIGLQTLKQAVEAYEALTGGTVGMERNAIADAVRKFSVYELKELAPVESRVRSLDLPVLETVEDYRAMLESLEGVSADDCVTTFAGSGNSLKGGRATLRKLSDCLDERGLATIRLAKDAVERMWPLLEVRGGQEHGERVETLRALLESEAFYESFQSIRENAEAVRAEYCRLYEQIHGERTSVYGEAAERVKGHPDWEEVPGTMRDPVLRPLTERTCDELDLTDHAKVCRNCGSSLTELESDLAACSGRIADAVAEVRRLTTPPEVKIQRVRIAEFFSDSVDDAAGVKRAVERLHDHLLKLLDEGVRIVVE